MGLVEREVRKAGGSESASERASVRAAASPAHCRGSRAPAPGVPAAPARRPCPAQWLLTIPSVEESDITFVDYVEEGRRLAAELAAQVRRLQGACMHACMRGLGGAGGAVLQAATGRDFVVLCSTSTAASVPCAAPPPPACLPACRAPSSSWL